MSHKGDIKLSTLNSNTPLAQRTADRMGILLAKSSVQYFSDGEIQISIDESARGKDIYLIRSASTPVNDSLMELLVMVDAIRRANARAINTVLSYYGYARQDRKTRACESITAELAASMLEATGVMRISSLDLHIPRVQGFFDIPVDNLMGAPLLTDYFLFSHLEKGAVVVSSGYDGVTYARKLAKFLKASIATVDKRRPEVNIIEAMNIIGGASGRWAVIIDDIIDTAGIITLATQALINAGTTEVYASATHVALSGSTTDRLDNSKVKDLVLTGSINQPEEKKVDKLQLVSVEPPMGDAIKLIEQHQPVSLLFNTRYRGN